MDENGRMLTAAAVGKLSKIDLVAQIAKMQDLCVRVHETANERGEKVQQLTQELNEAMATSSGVTKENLVAVVMEAVAKAVAVVNNRLGEVEKRSEKSANDVSLLRNEIGELRKAAVQQQRFIEYLEGKDRIENVVFFGVPEGNIEGVPAANDDEKCKAIFAAIGAVVQGPIVSKRVGRLEAGKTRPLILPMGSKKARDDVLAKTANLKTFGDEDHIFRKVYLKKDIHPAVSKEWKRIRDAEKREKENPANQGVEIKLNPDTRELMRDGVVIDRFTPSYFQ